MANAEPLLHRLAFDNAAQASIILDVNSGKIIDANKTACVLLGYSKKALLALSRATIFDTTEEGFKNMLIEREAEGHSVAKVKVIKKNGEIVECEITSAVFVDEDLSEKVITTITDLSQAISDQKDIDTLKEEIVADNIIIALEKSDRAP